MDLSTPYALEDLLRLAGALVLALLVMALSRWRGLGIGSELAWATVRSLIQLSLLALLLLTVFSLEDLYLVALVLVVMMVFAAHTAARRAMAIDDALRTCLVSILVSSIPIIMLMIVLGTIPMRAEYIIPIGGMVIGNSMNVIALSLDRLIGEVSNNVLRLESALALGASPEQASSTLVTRSVRSSLIPTVDNMRTLGLVWIPGLMSGMIIGGISPTTAAVFQLTVILMIMGSNTLASIVSTRMAINGMFGDADQLVFNH